jgi:integrase
VFRNEGLATALQEYRGDFRPLFDDGDCLFPSMLSPGAAISEGQIGVLVGNMTKAAFGVRVSVHRIRDNVATEASEALDGGGRAASRLLDHRDPATTARYYDHSVGMEATRDFEKLVSGRQSEPVDLLL